MKKIVVLLGGISKEKEVSIKTGEAIYKVLIENKIQVEKYYLEDNIDKFCNFLQDNHGKIIIFNALHGRYGEDGKIQGVLDLYNIPYTHSGVLASAVAMDKIVVKSLVRSQNIKVAKDQVIVVRDFKSEDLKINYPFVMKPINEGSSFGVYCINNKEELSQGLLKMQEYDQVMIEEFIKGVECTVGVLLGKSLEVTEIIPKNHFYDYNSKYTKGGNQQILPARFSNNIVEYMKNVSEKIYDMIQARGAIRVDFIYNPENNKAYFLEVNTQPGMTSTSLLPKQAQHKNISFYELCNQLILDASYDN